MAEIRFPRKASCACGALSVTAAAEPYFVHACSCVDCQRRSGSALSYTAFFPQSAVSMRGPSQTWRRVGAAGRWADTHFCPTCGCTVLMRLEALPDTIGVPAGAFADPDFPKPGKLYWASQRPRWLTMPAGVEMVQTQ